MGLPWFHMWAEFAHDGKVQCLPREVQRDFVMLLCLRCSGRLQDYSRRYCDVTRNADVTPRDATVTPSDVDAVESGIAAELRIDINTLRRSKILLIGQKLITDDWQIPNYDKRQDSASKGAERQRRWRERNK
jgi:hypothetical protein